MGIRGSDRYPVRLAVVRVDRSQADRKEPPGYQLNDTCTHKVRSNFTFSKRLAPRNIYYWPT